MSAPGYPFQTVGGVPVVTAPAEIDTTTAGQLRAILFEWYSRGHTTVVVDMTATQFCDSVGLRELVRAHKRAVADGGGLRLVMPADGAFLRIFTVTGLDGIVPRFATPEQAARAGRPPRNPQGHRPARHPSAQAWELGWYRAYQAAWRVTLSGRPSDRPCRSSRSPARTQHQAQIPANQQPR